MKLKQFDGSSDQLMTIPEYFAELSCDVCLEQFRAWVVVDNHFTDIPVSKAPMDASIFIDTEDRV